MAAKPHHHPNHIKRLRMEKGLTQRELAHIIGYQSVSSLSHLENGHKLPSIKTAMKLEAAFQELIPAIFSKLYDEVRTPVVRRRMALFQRREARKYGTTHQSISQV